MEKQTTNTTTNTTTDTTTQTSQSFDSTPTITNTFTNNVVPVTNYLQSPLTSTTLPLPVPITSASMSFPMMRSYQSTSLLALQQAEDANQHLKEVVVHEGQIMWACKFPKCWTLFKSQNSLNNHIRRYHMQNMQTNQDYVSRVQASEIHTSASGIQTFGNDTSSSSCNRKENSAVLYQCD